MIIIEEKQAKVTGQGKYFCDGMLFKGLQQNNQDSHP
jgi:hypothetical protein